MSDYVEFQDLKIRVNTGDAALATFTALAIHYIGPNGEKVSLAGAIYNSTWIEADIDPDDLVYGPWKIWASGTSIAGKRRKTVAHLLEVKPEGGT